MQHILLTLILSATFNAQAVIYGTDDRKDVVESARALNLSRSIAMMASDVFVTATPSGTENTYAYDFPVSTESYGMCKEEKFSSQPANMVACTGFLIGEDTLVTAGHCMVYPPGIVHDAVNAQCSTFKWVFDFKTKSNGQVDLQNIPADNVYSCERLIHADHTAYFLNPITFEYESPAGGQFGHDFAIIKLDRKVTGDRPILKMAPTVPLNEDLLVIGHPAGLPMKAAGNAKVLKHYDHYMQTDLDIIGGNSGSPVFNSNDEVVGIAVRSFPGLDTFDDVSQQCLRIRVCKSFEDCPGEGNEVVGTHVDKIFHVIDFLKSVN